MGLLLRSPGQFVPSTGFGATFGYFPGRIVGGFGHLPELDQRAAHTGPARYGFRNWPGLAVLARIFAKLPGKGLGKMRKARKTAGQ